MSEISQTLEACCSTPLERDATENVCGWAERDLCGHCFVWWTNKGLSVCCTLCFMWVYCHADTWDYMLIPRGLWTGVFIATVIYYGCRFHHGINRTGANKNFFQQCGIMSILCWNESSEYMIQYHSTTSLFSTVVWQWFNVLLCYLKYLNPRVNVNMCYILVLKANCISFGHFCFSHTTVITYLTSL